jgi:hypothetical protein
MPRSFNLADTKKEFARVTALTPEKAVTEYQASKIPPRIPNISADTVGKLSSSLDKRGAWVTSMTITNYDDPMREPKRINGIDTSVFIANIRTLANFVLKNR